MYCSWVQWLIIRGWIFGQNLPVKWYCYLWNVTKVTDIWLRATCFTLCVHIYLFQEDNGILVKPDPTCYCPPLWSLKYFTTKSGSLDTYLERVCVHLWKVWGTVDNPIAILLNKPWVVTWLSQKYNNFRWLILMILFFIAPSNSFSSPPLLFLSFATNSSMRKNCT